MVSAMTLNLNSCSKWGRHWQFAFLIFLSLFANTLTYLDVNLTSVKFTKDPAVNILLRKNIQFPYLKTFKCKVNGSRQSHPRESREAFEHVFMTNSPNLEELELDTISAQGYWPINQLRLYRTLKKLKLGDIVNKDEFLNCLRRSDIKPKVEILKLSFCWKDDLQERDVWRDTMNIFSTTLRSLSITMYSAGGRLPLVAFPDSLTQVEHLRVKLPIRHLSRARVDTAAMNFGPNVLPSLKKLDVSFGSILTDSDIFPSVKNLTLRMTEWSLWALRKPDQFGVKVGGQIRRTPNPSNIRTIKDHVQHLQQTFPNLSAISFINDCQGPDSEYVNQVIEELFESAKEWTDTINNFKMKNCNYASLGQRLTRFPPCKMTKLKMLTMECSEKYLAQAVRFGRCAIGKPFDISWVAQQFPGVYLDISPMLLTFDQKQNYEAAMAIQS